MRKVVQTVSGGGCAVIAGILGTFAAVKGTQPSGHWALRRGGMRDRDQGPVSVVLGEFAEPEPPPALSFGEPVLPDVSQQISVPGWIGRGRVVRVPVTNAFGSADARRVHARLVFEQTPGASAHPPEPTQADWFGEQGPEIEIDLPGNGRSREIDIAVVLEGRRDDVYEWTTGSRAASLRGYAIHPRPFDVEIEVMGTGGPTGPRINRTIRIDVQGGLIAAWWSDTPDRRHVVGRRL
jgi:hypothetical protein